MYGEAIVNTIDPDVVLDYPVVSLDLYPGGSGGFDHAHAVEMIVGDQAAGGPFFDVDVLSGSVEDIVVDYRIIVARVRMTAGITAPVFVGRANVNAFSEELHEQASVRDHAMADQVVAAEFPEMNSLVAG